MSHPRLTAPQRERVLLMHGQGYSSRRIASRVPCHHSTVARTILRYQRTGSTQQRNSPGRPSRITTAAQPAVTRLLRRATGATSADISRRVRRMGIARVSPRTIRRFRLQHGFRAVAPQEVRPLSDATIAKRMAWCEHQRGNRFNTTIFTDEAPFLIDNRNQVHYIQTDQPRPTTIPHQRHCLFMVWGGISYHHRTQLHFEPQDIDHDVDINILNTTPSPRHASVPSPHTPPRQCTTSS
jgi:transposase